MEIIVGIDVSKCRLDVHVVPSGESFSVDNSHAGVDALVGRFGFGGANLQAETLWVHVDEPIVNTYIQTIEVLDQTIAAQCRKLGADPDRIKSQTCFNWWPQNSIPN